MLKFVDFITYHWILSTAFGGTLLAFLVNEFVDKRWGATQISPEEAIQRINHQEALVLDVRNAAAFGSGHILGALHVPLLELEAKMSLLTPYRDNPLIVVCAVGQESSKVAAVLRQKGFLQVLVLRGGIRGWNAVSLPIVKS